jgi:hypothetical protein
VTSSRSGPSRSSASTSRANNPAAPGHPLPQRRFDASRTPRTSAKPDGTASQRSSSALTQLRLLTDSHRHHLPLPASFIGAAPNPPPPWCRSEHQQSTRSRSARTASRRGCSWANPNARCGARDGLSRANLRATTPRERCTLLSGPAAALWPQHWPARSGRLWLARSAEPQAPTD